jgi:hypothetical protein
MFHSSIIKKMYTLLNICDTLSQSFRNFIFWGMKYVGNLQMFWSKQLKILST